MRSGNILYRIKKNHMNMNRRQWKTYKTFKCEMQDNNDTAKQRKSKITYTRQESKSAGSHKQPDMRKAGVQKSYKATTRKKNKNTKYFGFHVYSSFCTCLWLLLHFHFHVCEMTKTSDGYTIRMIMMSYEIMTMIRWWWHDDDGMTMVWRRF